MSRDVHGLAVALLALLACGRGEHHSAGQSTETAKEPSPANTPTPASATPAAPRAYIAREARFSGETLVTCAELQLVSAAVDDLIASGKVDAGADELAADELKAITLGGKSLVGDGIEKASGKGAVSRLRLKGERTVLTKSCAEQFAGRTEIASCRVTSELTGKLAFSATIRLAYYDPTATLDGRMKDCLALKGEWNELPVNSLERGHARRMKLLEQMTNE